MMLASTFNRPRWAIASTISSIRCSPAFSIAMSKSGISVSAPSSEKLLAPKNRFWMNSSNMAALRQMHQNSILLAAAERQPILRAFHAHLQPLADGEIVHVHELHADRTAIGVPQPLDDAAERHHLRAFDRVGRKRPIHVGFGEVIRPRVEFREFRPRPAERIEIRHQMAAHPIRPDQLVDPILQDGQIVGGSGGRRRGAMGSIRRH